MAQRYTGRYSPETPDDGRGRVEAPEPAPLQFRGRAPQRFGTRLNLLFALPVVAVIGAFFNPPLGLAIDLAGAAILFLAAWLTRDGVRAEDAYNDRRVARRPAIPRKIFGSALTALGAAALVLGGTGAVLNAVIVGIVAGAAHFLSFGPDPLKNKGMEGIDAFQTERVARLVDDAEAHLSAMSDAIARAQDRTLTERVERFQDTAREMFRRVEEDPRDLTAARRYMGVYLQGARDATVKFADLWARSRDTQARADYLDLLDDLERNYAAKTDRLMIEDRSGLDVEIEVLRERLHREGVHIERQRIEENG